MSREAELYKDKIEVSLDGRQIFYLFFGGAVIVGLVFVLGVMVGRRVEARGHVDRARVAATVDPLAALDRLEGGTNLSFQGALRGAETESDVEKQIAAMQKGDAAPKKADAKKVEPSHEQPKVEPKVEPKKADAEVKKADVKKSDEPTNAEAKKSDDKKADAKKSDDAKTEPKSEAKKDEAKKVADASDKKADAEEKPATEEKKQKYTLQLSSFQDKREAEAYLDSIKSAGYEARVTEGTVDGKQYFRVRMGSYRSVEAANDAKAEFEKGAKKSAIVTRL
jgi:DedD protein